MGRRSIKLADVQQAMRPAREMPTPEQLAKGTYQDRFVTNVDDQTRAKAHVNAHSPVERWIRAGRLSDTQQAAIVLVRALWGKIELRQRLTSTYGHRIPTGSDNEWLANSEIQARKDLARIEGYFLPWQWEVWENVVRFDEPAGTAGSALGFSGTKAQQSAVLMLVKMVADMIAVKERLT